MTDRLFVQMIQTAHFGYGFHAEMSLEGLLLLQPIQELPEPLRIIGKDLAAPVKLIRFTGTETQGNKGLVQTGANVRLPRLYPAL